jgi:meiotic recombination protein REC8, fungi type
VLSSSIPDFDFGSDGNILLLTATQGSSNSLSQLTPRGQGSSSSGRGNSTISLDIPSSEFGTHQYPVPFGFDSSTHGIIDDTNPFVEDELEPYHGFSLEVDADGNLIDIMEKEPELPPLPRIPGETDEYPIGPFQDDPIQEVEQIRQLGQITDGGAVPLDHTSVAIQMDLEQASTNKGAQNGRRTDDKVKEASVSNAKRRRANKDIGFLDAITSVSRTDFKAWSETYVERCEAPRKYRHTTSVTKARKGAFQLVFGDGIANIGRTTGIPNLQHPLAEIFSGPALFRRTVGEGLEEGAPVKNVRRRRSALEAFENGSEEGRNVRQRVNEGDQGDAILDENDDFPVFLMDETLPEIGLEAATPLKDNRSSNIMPWNAPPSGTSIKSQGSTQHLSNRNVSASPLTRNGDAISDIERRSDNLELVLTSEGDFPPLMFPGRSSADGTIGLAENSQIDEEPHLSNRTVGGTETDLQKFLTYANEIVRNRGEVLDTDRSPNRRWVDFEVLADPAKHDHVVAAQAFYQVLSLATKNEMSLHQDYLQKGYGKILVGIQMDQDNDELEISDRDIAALRSRFDQLASHTHGT